MLVHLGNYSDWIRQEWLDYFFTHTGREMPKDSFDKGLIEKECADMGEKTDWFTRWGYTPDAVFCEQFKKDITPFDLDFPWIEESVKKWTVLKYKPGQFLPLHRDDVRFHNERRLWMPLTPYDPGHLYVHDGVLIKDWNVGDLFYFSKPDALHGIANVGSSIRLLLSLVVYNE